MRHLKFLQRTFNFILTVPVIGVIGLFVYDEKLTLANLGGAAFLYLPMLPIFSGPVYLHVTYYINSKGISLSNQGNFITVTRANEKKIIEVEKVIKYIRDVKIDKYYDIYIWSSYYYVKVISKSGEEYIFSCLVFDNIDNAFESEIVNAKYATFPKDYTLNLN